MSKKLGFTLVGFIGVLILAGIVFQSIRVKNQGANSSTSEGVNQANSLLPSGFNQVLVADVPNPTAMAFAPDGRIFVTSKNGPVNVIKNGVLLPTPFITLSTDTSGERGVNGIAFDPNFSSNNYVYIYYTLPTGANNRIIRVTANGDVAVPGSETTILNLDPLGGSAIHNGGALLFGPNDDKLYVAVGENATGSYGQSLTTNLGKILRINTDGTPAVGNPYYNTPGANTQQKQIWAYGVRNPFTMAADPASGKIFVNDVGWATWEEINDITAPGADPNFGWNDKEGAANTPPYIDPIYAYEHDDTFSIVSKGCAITGGAFVSPATDYPAQYIGKYFFIDFCNHWMDYIDPSVPNPTNTNFMDLNTVAAAPVGLTTGPNGHLYLLSRGIGQVYEIIYTPTGAPAITSQPQSITVAPGGNAMFSVIATGTAPLNYQWQKNGVDIAGETNSTYTISSVVAGDAGGYTVVVTNASGTDTSNIATLIVSTNQPPVVSITLPATGTNYNIGDTINFVGTATDPEDGILPASAFSWGDELDTGQVEFHHNVHFHPGPLVPAGVKSGSFVAADLGEIATDVFFRLYLTVTDSAGAKAQTYVDIVPNVSNITLDTNPTGFQVTIDDVPGTQTTPYTIPSVVGMIRDIDVITPLGYIFSNWSQGGAQNQSITTPSIDTTYTANFIPTAGPTISEVTPVPTPTNDSTPDYTFTSDKAGTITYGGSCSSGMTSAVIGNNTITMSPLSDGVHTSCTITVTDGLGNVSNTLNINNFIIDSIPPVISATAPATNSTIALQRVSYTLSETVTTASVVWTRTGGTADPGSPHTCILQGLALNNTAHINVPMSIGANKCSAWPNPLVSGAIYTVTFNASDFVSNSAITITNTNVLYDTTVPDTTAPIISEVTPVATPTNDPTPDYTFTTNEAGVITYGGSCASTTTNASVGSNTITFSALSDGAYSNCTITVTDSSNNISNILDIPSFIIDATAPIISTTAPATNAVINLERASYTLSETIASGSIVWTRTFGSADAGSPHTCALQGSALNAGAHTNLAMSVAANRCNAWPTTLVSGAFYTVTFNAIDLIGNSATTITKTNVLFDTTDPSVAVTLPSTGATLTGTVTLTATATDTSGINHVEFYWTQGGNSTLIGGTVTNVGNVYSLSWDTNTTLTPDGVYDLFAVAYDNATPTENSMQSSFIMSVIIDNPFIPPADTTDPIGSWNNPLNGATFTSGMINLDLSASDPGAYATGVTYVDFSYKKTADPTYTGISTSNGLAGHYYGAWDATGYSGSYMVRGVVHDGAGNMTTVTITITLNTPPAFPNTGGGGSVVYSYEAQQKASIDVKKDETVIETPVQTIYDAVVQVGGGISALPITTGWMFYGKRGLNVSVLQAFLATNTYWYPEGTIDGRFGSFTRKAVKRFQAENNITADGIVGPKTIKKMNNAFKVEKKIELFNFINKINL